MAIYEAGAHFSDALSPRKPKLTRQHKKYCDELAALRIKPVRVRNALRSRFGLQGDALPRLRTAQNYINYYSKTQLGCSDDDEDIVQTVQYMEFREGADENLPISLTYDKTMDGQLNVGDGSDEEPFSGWNHRVVTFEPRWNSEFAQFSLTSIMSEGLQKLFRLKHLGYKISLSSFVRSHIGTALE
ncbi:unnamed protein product [Phytophthora fragariaefolia]|uniref:Unnamed protein product n=1 Tax=Phytophthora fragariaefolia TaxID=1490495 RepID=A0A9W6TM00_9STRA|nr:unnamed protein product [Phytophthora fragariaefolia]